MSASRTIIDFPQRPQLTRISLASILVVDDEAAPSPSGPTHR
jgi:hypothetical protein